MRSAIFAFPMARKPSEDGYRASAVDNFMDKLEISYAQLTEELEQLRAGGSGGEVASSEADDALRNELEERASRVQPPGWRVGCPAQRARASLQTASSQLHQENERLSSEVARCADSWTSCGPAATCRRPAASSCAPRTRTCTVGLEELRGQLNNSQQELAAAQQRAEAAQQAPARRRGRCWTAPTAMSARFGSPRVRGQLGGCPVGRTGHRAGRDRRPTPMPRPTAGSPKPQARPSAPPPKPGHVPSNSTTSRVRAPRKLDRESKARADQLDAESKSRAEQLDAETRQQADRILGEARVVRTGWTPRFRERRAELFTGLESDRDVLVDRVNQLRDYEENYRRTSSTVSCSRRSTSWARQRSARASVPTPTRCTGWVSHGSRLPAGCPGRREPPRTELNLYFRRPRTYRCRGRRRIRRLHGA